jgi:hypothetical protein
MLPCVGVLNEAYNSITSNPEHGLARSVAPSRSAHGAMMTAVALDLFGTPASIGVTHVRWWLDRWDELQSSVA